MEKGLIMKTGVERIQQERTEQIEKHGYSRQKDREQNMHGQLAMAAMFCITLDRSYWPATWNMEYRDKIAGKNQVERYSIAGALLAAEIDRQTGVEEDNDYMCQQCEDIIPEEEWNMFGGYCEECSMEG